MLYIVLATHETSRGQQTHAIFATDDMEKAIEVARKSITLGFVFKPGEGVVCIDRIHKDRVYSSTDFRFNPFLSGRHDTTTRPSFLVRRKTIQGNDWRWEEEWFDEKAKQKFQDSRYA